jgi:hypothetical protein
MTRDDHVERRANTDQNISPQTRGFATQFSLEADRATAQHCQQELQHNQDRWPVLIQDLMFQQLQRVDPQGLPGDD